MTASARIRDAWSKFRDLLPSALSSRYLPLVAKGRYYSMLIGTSVVLSYMGVILDQLKKKM